MAVVISSSLVISDTVSGGGVIGADNPVIGYENLITDGNTSSTTEETDYPATNLANVSTALRWQGVAASPVIDEYLTFALATAELVDYVGIAKHNFYTGQIAVSVEVLNSATSPASWDEVIAPFIPSSDGPLIMRFTPQAIESIRVRLQPGSAAPRAGVAYAGRLLVLQRRIYVGHTPVNFATVQSLANHYSISGDFLGRIVLSEKTELSVRLENLTPAWYREYLEPFRLAAKTVPFFFAWRPASYPFEVGFVWTTKDPQPANARPNGMMSFSFDCGGVT